MRKPWRDSWLAAAPLAACGCAAAACTKPRVSATLGASMAVAGEGVPRSTCAPSGRELRQDLGVVVGLRDEALRAQHLAPGDVGLLVLAGDEDHGDVPRLRVGLQLARCREAVQVR